MFRGRKAETAETAFSWEIGGWECCFNPKNTKIFQDQFGGRGTSSFSGISRRAREHSSGPGSSNHSPLLSLLAPYPPHQDCPGVGPFRVLGSHAPSQTQPPPRGRHKRGLCGAGASPQCSRLQWARSQTCGAAPGRSRWSPGRPH